AVGIASHGRTPARGASAIADVTHAIRQRADRDVLARHRARTRASRVLAFGREAGGHPVELAGLVVGDVSEPEELEPRRGPGRHVSSRIPAVHDDRSVWIERGCGLST